jgi:hypothetical protein
MKVPLLSTYLFLVWVSKSSPLEVPVLLLAEISSLLRHISSPQTYLKENKTYVKKMNNFLIWRFHAEVETNSAIYILMGVLNYLLNIFKIVQVTHAYCIVDCITCTTCTMHSYCTYVLVQCTLLASKK